MADAVRNLTPAQAELIVARDQVKQLVDVLRRSDPDYVRSHGVEPTMDEEWDKAIEEAEDWLEQNGEDGP